MLAKISKCSWPCYRLRSPSGHQSRRRNASSSSTSRRYKFDTDRKNDNRGPGASGAVLLVRITSATVILSVLKGGLPRDCSYRSALRSPARFRHFICFFVPTPCLGWASWQAGSRSTSPLAGGILSKSFDETARLTGRRTL